MRSAARDRCVRIALTLLALATAERSRASAATCDAFGTAVHYGVGSKPTAVAIGDVNADGHPDLVIANYLSTFVSVLLGNGNGTFAAAVDYDAGSGPYSVAIADLSGDGKPDLVATNYASSNVSILLGSGTGTFAPAVNYAVGSQPLSVAVGDLNGDGKLDLAVANQAVVPGTVSILIGSGDGTFATAVTYEAGSNDPASLVLGDVNGDGTLDLAVGTLQSLVTVLIGNGNGTFATAVGYGATYATSVALGDLNGDGRLDIAAAGSNVSILTGNGNGTFAAAVNYPVSAAGGALGDLDGDGNLDVAFTSSFADSVSILRGNAFGTFATADTCGAGTFPRAVAVGDVNHDGKPDLAVANFNSDNVSILLNTSPAFASAFTDDPLTPTTPVKAIHVTELRNAIATLRTRQNLSPFSLTDSLLTPGSTAIRAAHIIELRTALNGVYDALGVDPPAYADSSLTAATSVIKRVHVAQLREAARAVDWPLVTAIRSGTGHGTVTSSPAGISCGAACAKTYPPGTPVTLTATPSADSTFTGWSGACSGTATCQFTLNTDTSVTATFSIRRYTLTLTKAGGGTGSVTSDPAGISCGADCQEVYDIGTSVTLAPIASPGSSFANWTGACSGSGACSVTMNADVTVGATFNVFQPATLTVTKAGAGTGTVTSSPVGITCGGDCQEIYNVGTAVTLTPSAASGSYFANWTGACSSNGGCTVTMTGDLTVGATFSLPAPIDVQPRSYFLGVGGACLGSMFTEQLTVTAPAGIAWTATWFGTPTDPPHTEQLSPASGTGSGTTTFTLTVPPRSPSFGHTCSDWFDFPESVDITFKFYGNGVQVDEIESQLSWTFRLIL